MLYQRTTVAHGTAHAVVVAAGAHTKLGRIGELAAGVMQGRTPLERRLEMIETGVALAIAAVPEGLACVGIPQLALAPDSGVRSYAARRVSRVS